MGLFNFLGNLISKEAKKRARVPVTKTRDLTGQTGINAQAEQHYVQLILSEMFLKKSGEWFTTRYPLVYSLIALRYGDQPKLEFANVSGKNKFEIKQTDLDHSILRNYPLTPLLPFRGGEVEIDLGLTSMKASNLIESFAKTVSDVAGTLKLAQIAEIANISSAIAGGVQSLLGAGESKTMLSVHDMMLGGADGVGTVVSGFVLLSGLEETQYTGKLVWVTADGVRIGPDDKHLAPLSAQDYILLQVRVTTTRDDWQSLSAIGKPLDGAIEAKLKGQTEEAKALLVQAKMAAYRSADLTRTDAARVVTAIDKYFKDTALIESVMAASGQEALVEGMDGDADAGLARNTHLGQAMQLLGNDPVPPLEEIDLFAN